MPRRLAAMLLAAFTGCAGGHVLREVAPEDFPPGEYVSTAQAAKDPAAAAQELSAAFQSCGRLTLAGYAAELTVVEVQGDSIRVDGVDREGRRSGLYRLTGPMPRLLPGNKVSFPPFSRLGDLWATSWRAELQAECRTVEAARRLIDAVAALHAPAAARAAPSADFERNVERYKKLKGGPLPEDAAKLKTQAEDAARGKRPEEALGLYERVIEAAPWWAEGYRRRALLLAELGRFHDAIDTMQRFLALEPPPSEAQEAKDKIYTWEGRLP
ncbi:MAG: tetratricopeptide repeat protein [Elusimicrobia bacterium]|nr:tetratricopeptide repeat protein [Elusimicrobiota bacterium]